jgi:hypothetical protein
MAIIDGGVCGQGDVTVFLQSFDIFLTGGARSTIASGRFGEEARSPLPSFSGR